MTLALVFAFVLHWGIVGLWAGFSIACIVLDIGFFFIICLPNWDEIAEKQINDLNNGKCSASNSLLGRSFGSVSPSPSMSRAMLPNVGRSSNEMGRKAYELPGFGNEMR